jgi:G8 domain
MKPLTMRRRLAIGVQALLLVAACWLVADASALLPAADQSLPAPRLIRSAQSGPWSAPATWEGGRLPAAGSRVQIRQGHTVAYDMKSDRVIRSIHVAGVLRFPHNTDTRLDVGLIKIQPGDDASENGFDCDAHAGEPREGEPRPALEVGTPNQPIDAGRTALIRLTYVDGLDKQSCPAIVCCGGRMDFHGAPLSRTWVKLGATARKGDAVLTLAETVTGWKVGDRVIITATRLTYLKTSSTEERTIQAIDGGRLTLDQPLEVEHQGDGLNKGEVANLSRNVVVESADPAGERGHTMYHRDSAGAISYAEFRHLGKKGVLGRYAIHFHLVRDTMRGSSVIGASVWDSHNRWVTIHGTDFLVVRDCVGYQSIGHGFFMEDATEQYNVLDRNLAVQASQGKPLPKQMLPFDANEGAGFWWANGRNTFTRNVSCDNDHYGYFFDIATDKVVLPLRMPDGAIRQQDVLRIPFFRFEDNEAHTHHLYGFKFGDDRISRLLRGDRQHPFIVRNLKVWETHYNLQPSLAYFLLDGLKLSGGTYGVYRPEYDHHVYRNLSFHHIGLRGLGRAGSADGGGYDAVSVQQGPFTCENVTFEDCRCGQPFIAFNATATQAGQSAHFRNIVVTNSRAREGSVNDYVSLKINLTHGVSYYFHDYPARSRTTKVVSARFPDLMKDGNYRLIDDFTGDKVRATEVSGVEFPVLLDPVDDLPPATVITHVRRLAGNKVIVRGTTSDNGTVTRVLVNGKEARSVGGNFAEWEIVLAGVPDGPLQLQAHGEDGAGNVEKRPHTLVVH